MDCFLKALHNNVNAINEYLVLGNVNVVDEYGSSLLHYAVRGNAMDVANVLIINYIDLNIKNKQGETPLFEAVRTGQIGFVKLLLRHHADYSILNNKHESLFFRAILKNNNEVLNYLFTFTKIDFELVNSDGENILFYLVKSNNMKLFNQVLVKYPNFLFNRDYLGRNILQLAIMYNNLDIIKLSIDSGISIYQSDKENNNSLFYAAKYANRHTMNYLLNKSPIIDGKNINGEDIISLCKKNQYYLLDLINNYLNSYDYLQYKNNFIYHIAIISRDYDLLMNNHIDKNKRDNHGISLDDLIKVINDENIYKLFNK